MQDKICTYFHTDVGKTEANPTDTSLPQAAPVNKSGINKPFEVESPNVQQDKKKYIITNIPKDKLLCVFGGS